MPDARSRHPAGHDAAAEEVTEARSGTFEYINTAKRLAPVFLLGFCSGLPFALSGTTLQVQLSQEGLSLESLGMISLLGLPYTCKFLWAPILDRFSIPFLGRRKFWILLSQIAIVVGVSLLAFRQANTAVVSAYAIALFIAFASATQDIAIDAYRREILRDAELGLGAGISNLGYRLGMIASGGGLLILVASIGWKLGYLVFAALMGFCALLALLCPEPQRVDEEKQHHWWEAFREILVRPYIAEILAFILMFKMSDVLLNMMAMPFLLAAGYDLKSIGIVFKTGGIAATIAGGLIAGGVMLRISLKNAVLIFGAAQLLSTLAYLALLNRPPDITILAAVVVVENLCSGLGTAAFVAFLMLLCDKRFTGTQYAILSGAFALSRSLLGSSAGFLATTLGWPHFFLTAALLGIPALLLAEARFNSWQRSFPSWCQPPISNE